MIRKVACLIWFYCRYLAVEITPSDSSQDLKHLNIKSGSLYKAITSKVQQLHGDFGAASIRAGFVAKYVNESTRIALIRVRHGPHRFVATSLPFITSINSKPVTLQTLYTGATIKHCFKFIINYHQSNLIKVISSFKTDEDRVQYQKELNNLDNIMDM